jgi:diguanylate cyclase (GGDEF)-like protein/PAS domain S-box-containing protein
VSKEGFMAHGNVAARLQKSIIVSSAVSIVLFGLLVAGVSIVPLYQHLTSDAEQTLSLGANTRAVAVNEYLTRTCDVAAQITSRTQIRVALERYNQGEMTHEELVEFSAPKLADALAQSPEIAGMVRYDQAGAPVVQLGLEYPLEQLPPPGASDTVKLYEPALFEGESYLIVSAPIPNAAGQLVGTDMVIFELERLRQIVNDTTDLNADSEVLLALYDGNQIQPLLPDMSFDGAQRAMLERAYQQQQAQGVLQPGEQGDSVMAYSRLDNEPWLLAIATSTQQLYAPVYRQIHVLSALILALLLAGILGMSYLLRPLTGKLIVHTDELKREIREKTATLHAERHRNDLILQAVGEGVLGLDAHDRISFANPAAIQMVGYTADDLIGQSVHILRYTASVSSNGGSVHSVASSEDLISEFFRRQDGSLFPVEIICTPMLEQDGPVGKVITFRDITRRQAAEEQLRHQALHDTLTGLPNRAMFLQLLQDALANVRQTSQRPFAVLFLDLDHFTMVNDSLGHLAGDHMLTTTAQRLEECLRSQDIVARFGGDEFVILLDNISTDTEAALLAERIQRAINQPVQFQEYEMGVSASIGIALSARAYEHPDHLLRDADAALYWAKTMGQSRYAVFDTTMHTHALERLHLDAALRRALEQHELRVHYQPIVSLEHGEIVGFEALVRWYHPQRGIVSPGAFIPIAEETGLIVPLSWFVLREACRQTVAWQRRYAEQHDLTISVNLSGKALMRVDVVDQLRRILEETGLDARSLKLEITENVMVDHAETTIDTLRRLRELGVSLGIDDFGTGYSSLRYLHRFPIQTLKIDRSFIDRLCMDAESAAIVQSIVMLSHALQIELVAEGIETEQQLAALHELHCEYGQGYLFARPLDSAAAEALLTTWAAPAVGVLGG